MRINCSRCRTAEYTVTLTAVDPASVDLEPGALCATTSFVDCLLVKVVVEPGDMLLAATAARILQRVATETSAAGAVRYVAKYGNYGLVSGVPMPAAVRFEVPAQDAKIDLRYSDVSLNATLSAGLFSFEAPDGSKIVDLDTIGSLDSPTTVVAR